MRKMFLLPAFVVCGVMFLSYASAEQVSQKAAAVPPMLSLSQVEKTAQTVTEEGTSEKLNEFQGVSNFFNIREANPSVCKNQWGFELNSMWQTLSNGSDDDVFFWPSLRYGVTEDMFAELEVLPVNIGDGGDQGNGDLGLILFNRFVRKSCNIPAIAGWAEMRIPSGQGSSGVDGAFHLNLTKTICPKFRTHLGGFVETANGERSTANQAFVPVFGGGALGGFASDGEGRRNFQWGVGPGFDYQFTENTIGVLNYLMRSSEENGQHNSNILEVGASHKITCNQTVKLALDIGLDGQDETPNFATKIQWGITF